MEIRARIELAVSLGQAFEGMADPPTNRLSVLLIGDRERCVVLRALCPVGFTIFECEAKAALDRLSGVLFDVLVIDLPASQRFAFEEHLASMARIAAVPRFYVTEEACFTPFGFQPTMTRRFVRLADVGVALALALRGG